jgi:hypothetical protein
MTAYVGLNTSKEESSLCVVDGAGKVLWSGKALSDPASIFAPRAWRLMWRGDVTDARQAHAAMKPRHNKTDANDARLLAEIARTGFFARWRLTARRRGSIVS